MQNRRLVIWIVFGVFVWGVIHALGAYVNYKFDSPWRVWRGVVVLLFVEAFLGFWLLLLWLRRVRSTARGDGRERSSRERFSPVNPQHTE